MKVHKTKWWELTFPESWELTITRDDVRFRLESGTEIKITSIRKHEGDVITADLKKYAAHALISGTEEQEIEMGVLHGITVRGNDGNTDSIYLCSNSLMLVIICNYEGNIENQDRESVHTTISGINLLI